MLLAQIAEDVEARRAVVVVVVVVKLLSRDRGMQTRVGQQQGRDCAF